MAEDKLGYWFRIRMFWSGMGWVFRKVFRERFLIPRPRSLQTAAELMEVVAELNSEHGGMGSSFKYVQRALELEPNHLQANEFMANYYLTIREYSEAMPYALLVAQRRPDSVLARITLCDILMKLRRFEGALNELDSALRLSPTSPGLWTMRGEALSALGRHAEAADAYARQLTLENNCTVLTAQAYASNPEAAVAYGRELNLSGHTENALKVWLTVVRMENAYLPTRKEAEGLIASTKNKPLA
jgi:predicted Zn-dependent protease